jgi:hypothetical protein
MQQDVCSKTWEAEERMKKNKNVPIPAAVCREGNVCTGQQLWRIRQLSLRKAQVTSELSGSTAFGWTRCLEPVWLDIIKED